MPSGLKLHRLVGAGVFLITLGMYVKTMAPTVSFWDCGEFIACSYMLGVPHPPGSPLYVLLGRLFTLIPIDDVASRVVFMSALSSALAVGFIYLSTVALARRALGGAPLRAFDDERDFGVAAGAAVAAFCLAFSYTFWFNATEAEVYAYSLFFTCCGLWTILYWEGTQHGSLNDRWLYFIAYVFGLGGGLHMLCLLTIPTLLVLAWFRDRELRRLMLVMVGLGLTGLTYLTLFASQPPSARLLALLAALAAVALYGYVWNTHPNLRSTVRILAGGGLALLLARGLFGTGHYIPINIGGSTAMSLDPVASATGLWILHHLYREDRRAFGLLIGTGFLFALGYSTYLTLFIRSGLNPAIDMNDPETGRGFLKFLNREQYGTDSQLLSMLTARSSRAYQFWHQQIKYFLQQFPFFMSRDVTFRWATEQAPHIIPVSPIPYLLGLGGMAWHASRDGRRFLAFLALFAIMGFGLSFYLNMPDPQPRERHYVFGGMFLAFAMWMGLGWTGIVEWIRQRYSAGRPLVLAVACFGLLLPIGIGRRLYHVEDRTGDFVAYDYAYNLLTSCGENGLLFTNGDNDTFPLWYIQEVEGVRPDVRVVNLSLLNTNWYIKQLRDEEPKVDIRLTDTFIDSVLTDTQMVDLRRRLWLKPQTPGEYLKLGLDVSVVAPPGHDLLRIQDWMVIGIAYWNNWERPIHFAITVAASNRTGLDPYLRMDGMVMTLVREKDAPPDVDLMADNLLVRYQYRGINDPSVYKDVNTTRLLGNYRACIMSLAEAYERSDRLEELAHLFSWAARTLPRSWEMSYTASEHHRRVGMLDSAAGFVEQAADELLAVYGHHPSATYGNLLALCSTLLNTYRDYDRAERLYYRAIALEPERFDGYHELAATLQAGGKLQEAIAVMERYQSDYGPLDEAQQDLTILQNSLRKHEGALDSAAAQTVRVDSEVTPPE